MTKVVSTDRGRRVNAPKINLSDSVFTEHWNSLPRVMVMVPSLLKLKKHLDKNRQFHSYVVLGGAKSWT